MVIWVWLCVPKVFINYRRADTSSEAGRLRDWLARPLGVDLVFRDVDGIPPGTKFEPHIDEQLDKSAVVLALIGKNWEKEIVDREKAGTKDYVRRELVRAIEKQKVIIPVLVEGATLPADLPADLAPLASRQITALRDTSWAEDVKRILGVLKRPPRFWGLVLRAFVASIVIFIAVFKLLPLASHATRRDMGFVRLVFFSAIGVYLALDVFLLSLRFRRWPMTIAKRAKNLSLSSSHK
jgi:hypothetical protein